MCHSISLNPPFQISKSATGEREREYYTQCIQAYASESQQTHFIPIATTKLIAPTKNITPRPTRVDADIHSSMMGINASLQNLSDCKVLVQWIDPTLLLAVNVL